MPPDAARRYGAYEQWQAVQAALTAWRKRTWTGSADAKAATQRNIDQATEFAAWAGLSGMVLDVGCGSGWIASVMPSVAYHGIDPMPADVEYQVPFVRGISDRLPFPEQFPDVLLLVQHRLRRRHRRDARRGAPRAQAGWTDRHCDAHSPDEHVDGERLHNHRFLSGEFEALLHRVFGAEATSKTSAGRRTTSFDVKTLPADFDADERVMMFCPCCRSESIRFARSASCRGRMRFAPDFGALERHRLVWRIWSSTG